MPSQRELTIATIEQLRMLLVQLDHVYVQATELSAQITAQMNGHARANRPARSNAATPEMRRVRRKPR